MSHTETGARTLQSLPEQEVCREELLEKYAKG